MEVLSVYLFAGYVFLIRMFLFLCWCVVCDDQARVQEVPNRKLSLKELNDRGSSVHGSLSVSGSKQKKLDSNLTLANSRWNKVITLKHTEHLS